MSNYTKFTNVNGDDLEVMQELPNDPTKDGYVLTYDATSEEAVWLAPQGGGSSAVEVIDFHVVFDRDARENVLIHVSKSSAEALQIVLSHEKQVIARLCRVDVNDHSRIIEITVYPFSYMYYSDGIYPTMFFNWGEGSGGGAASIKGDEEEWSSGFWDRVELE